MDFYAFFWGVIKYLLPAILFIISVVISPNVLLLIISVSWIMASILISALTMEKNSGSESY